MWVILSRMVYDKGWEATSHKQLIRGIKQEIKEVNLLTIQAMVRNVKYILRKIEDNEDNKFHVKIVFSRKI